MAVMLCAAGSLLNGMMLIGPCQERSSKSLCDASIGGLKVVAGNGWIAARPSGTENIYKIYAESFRDASHLDAIVGEAQQIVSDALAAKEAR